MLLIPKDLGDVSSLKRVKNQRNISKEPLNQNDENGDQENIPNDMPSKGSTRHDNSLYTNTLKSNRDERSYENNEEKSQSEAENNKILFDNILDYINKDSEEEDVKEELTNWRFSVFNLQRRIYYLYNSIDRETFVDIPFEGDSEILSYWIMQIKFYFIKEYGEVLSDFFTSKQRDRRSYPIKCWDFLQIYQSLSSISILPTFKCIKRKLNRCELWTIDRKK